VFGMKGAGEGGAIAPPAAIANAVTDALREFGAEMNQTPMTPARVWGALNPAPAAGQDAITRRPAPRLDAGAALPDPPAPTLGPDSIRPVSAAAGGRR